MVTATLDKAEAVLNTSAMLKTPTRVAVPDAAPSERAPSPEVLPLSGTSASHSAADDMAAHTAESSVKDVRDAEPAHDAPRDESRDVDARDGTGANGAVAVNALSPLQRMSAMAAELEAMVRTCVVLCGNSMGDGLCVRDTQVRCFSLCCEDFFLGTSPHSRGIVRVCLWLIGSFVRVVLTAWSGPICLVLAHVGGGLSL